LWRFRAAASLLRLIFLSQWLVLPMAGALRAQAPEPLPQGIVVRTTENVTEGGWVWLLNQCQAHHIRRIDLLMKQDEDDFHSPRTGRTLQSGELLAALPGEKTAAGWENSEWLRQLLARAKELKIEVWAWWPCFHDAQAATAFPQAAYASRRGEKFVDAAVPAVQVRQEALLAKLLDAYPFDGVSLDWVRYNAWPDGSRGPLGESFARRFKFDWTPDALANDYSKARWYEARAAVIADWVERTTRALRERRPGVRFGAFLLPPQFTEASQSYPMLGRAGLDFLQPMCYWTDWKQPPQWAGEGVLAPFSRAPAKGTAYWPALGINSPAPEISAALRSLPADALGGVSWFNYGSWEQRTFDKLRDLPPIGDPAATTATATTTEPKAPLTGIPAMKGAQPKEFPADASVWSIVCLGELYKRGALAGQNNDPVCPVLAFHTFAEAEAGTPVYLYKCSTAYLDALLKTIADAGFQVAPLSRLQSFLITGDPAMLPPKPLVLTIDDGSESVFRLFAPRAAPYRFPYTLALVTSWLSETAESDHATPEPGKPDPTMTWAQAKELYASGRVEVISHSDGLHYMAAELPGSDDALPAETIRQFLVEKNRVETLAEYERRIRLDMITSRRKLAEHGFRPPSVFCWPYGEWTQNAKAIGAQTGFTHFLAFDTPPIFVSRDSAADADLPRVPVLRWDEQVPLTFPADHAEQQAWWLAFLKVARQSQSRRLLSAALAQLAPENADHPQAEISRATLEMLNGNAAVGTERLLRLRRARPFDANVLAAIDQTLAMLAPGPRPKLTP
jgi:hypothetical protein